MKLLVDGAKLCLLPHTLAIHLIPALVMVFASSPIPPIQSRLWRSSSRNAIREKRNREADTYMHIT